MEDMSEATGPAAGHIAAGVQIATKQKQKRAKSRGLWRLVRRAVRRAEELNRNHAVHGERAVFDNAMFPWVAEIEAEWRLVRAELERLLARQEELPAFQEVVSDATQVTRDRHWKTVFLLGYGVRFKRNIARCPETWRILQKVPGLKTAMFSILEPGKHIPPHRDPYNGVLRLHIGLIVPEPRDRLAIRVADQVCHWEEGKALVFDDHFEHEAWNGTDQTRVVLFADFAKPLRFPANLVNGLLLGLARFTPRVRDGRRRHRAWEERFYASGGKWWSAQPLGTARSLLGTRCSSVEPG
jgi:ornithine lipid ester-linked acyl 2-hydroxylase